MPALPSAFDTVLVILGLITPLFSLIGLGWLLARGRVLAEPAPRVLTEFAIKIAMPAMLFRAMLSVGEAPATLLLMPVAYFSATLVVWVLASLATALVLRRPQADGAAIAMACCFGNGVMLGFPLLVTTLGPQTAVPAALLSAIETPLLWIIATLHVSAADRAGRGLSWPMLRAILGDLLRNTIIMSMVLGVAWRLAGLPVPVGVDRVLALLGGAAVPVMLIALGMSLAAYEIRGQLPTLSVITLLKLGAYPVIAYLMAAHVFALPAPWVATVVAFASMPVGANAFVFASKYDRAVNSVSAALTVSTIISIVSITVVLALLRLNGTVGN